MVGVKSGQRQLSLAYATGKNPWCGAVLAVPGIHLVMFAVTVPGCCALLVMVHFTMLLEKW